MNEREIENISINIYSQVFVDADELGNCANLLVLVSDSRDTNENLDIKGRMNV
ncbi:MAG: hypothetical protein NC548_06175 [Lachnospiraceae bacterium]|nr:hypothetical protein [Lachnospiraceae bacterium]